MTSSNKTFAFIDASNLFYGGEKSLGWKIDYQKLAAYLKEKYEVSSIYYFGGVETFQYQFNYLENSTVNIEELRRYLADYIHHNKNKFKSAKLALINRHISRTDFYLKLKSFGYKLFLKPVKSYLQPNGRTERKANCDVEMAFYLMKTINQYSRVVILSGDGDFLPVLKHLKQKRKQVIILSRGERTAKEIKAFSGSNFRDFITLRKALEYK